MCSPVYCVLGRCNSCYDGVLCGSALYCVLWRCNVCYGGVLYVRVMY